MQSLTLQATTGAGTTFALGGGFTVFSVFALRAAPGTGGQSTKASIKLQGSVDGVHYFSIGAATMAITSTGGTQFARSSTIGPVTYARLSVNAFTTVAATSKVGPDKVAVTGFIACQGV